jgi:hypothetical protein
MPEQVHSTGFNSQAHRDESKQCGAFSVVGGYGGVEAAQSVDVVMSASATVASGSRCFGVTKPSSHRSPRVQQVTSRHET